MAVPGTSLCPRLHARAVRAAYDQGPGVKFSSNPDNKGEVTGGVKDGAAVTFSIYPDGADPEKDPPLQDIRGVNRGSRAEVKWVAKDIRKPDSDNDMNWFFTAWTLYCPKEKSSTMEVTRVLPEFSELKWELVTYDEDGNEESREETSKVYREMDILLSAQVQNLEEKENVYLKIYDVTNDSERKEIHRYLISVSEGAIQYSWNTSIKVEESSEPIIPQLLFTLNSMDYREEAVESGIVECFEAIRASLSDEGGAPLKNINYKIVTESGSVVREGQTDENGKLFEDKLGIGKYFIKHSSRGE